MTDSRDGPVRLPALYWGEGYVFPEPEGYVPSFVEGDGFAIDENRLPLILDAIMRDHPKADRLAEVARTRPGLSLKQIEGEDWIVGVRNPRQHRRGGRADHEGVGGDPEGGAHDRRRLPPSDRGGGLARPRLLMFASASGVDLAAEAGRHRGLGGASAGASSREGRR